MHFVLISGRTVRSDLLLPCQKVLHTLQNPVHTLLDFSEWADLACADDMESFSATLNA